MKGKAMLRTGSVECLGLNLFEGLEGMIDYISTHVLCKKTIALHFSPKMMDFPKLSLIYQRHKKFTEKISWV